MTLKQELEQDIELAKMMVTDIDKIYRKYAKAALQATEERVKRIRSEKYHGCTTVEDLQDLYGYGDITMDEYDAGRDFLQAREDRMKQLSLVELHRKNLKDLRNRWKGTVNELQEELDELNGVKKEQLSYVKQLEKKERAERYAAMS